MISDDGLTLHNLNLLLHTLASSLHICVVKTPNLGNDSHHCPHAPHIKFSLLVYFYHVIHWHMNISSVEGDWALISWMMHGSANTSLSATYLK